VLRTSHDVAGWRSCREAGKPPKAGGVISISANFPLLYERSASYVDKIIKGAKPADLPVEQPTKFQVVLNTKTARALDLTISPTLVAHADEVIE
jgi:putative ABC transport system substrate-binding protein